MRFLEKLSLIVVQALAVCLLASCAARAQVSYVSPQTAQQTLAPSGTACNGTAQTYQITNLGQTQHMVSFTPAGSPTQAVIQIWGTDTLGEQFPISDPALAGSYAVTLRASGYYPTEFVTVSCGPNSATYNLTYMGTSATPDVNAGLFLNTEIDKVIYTAAIGTTDESTSFFTPFGSSGGTIAFSYSASAVAGSTLSINCQGTNPLFTNFKTYTVSLANTTAEQNFPVPAMTCPLAVVTYTHGGAAGTINLEYLFDQPGQQPSFLGSYQHITGTTATVVKAGGGTLLSLIVGTPAAGTISFFDLPAASCTATPSTQIVSVVTATATAPLASILYNVGFQAGICVKASVGMDLTISYQ